MTYNVFGETLNPTLLCYMLIKTNTLRLRQTTTTQHTALAQSLINIMEQYIVVSGSYMVHKI